MRKLELNSFTQYQFISGVQFSPCAQKISYHIHQADVEENSYTSNIWLTDLSTNQSLQLTSSGKASQHFWLENTDMLLYPSLKDPKVKERVELGEPLTAYYSIQASGGESIPYMEIPLSVTQIKAIDTERFLITGDYCKAKENFHLLADDEKKAILKKEKEENAYEIIEEIPFWQNGGSFTRGHRNRLYLYDRMTSELTPISNETQSVTHFEWHEKTQEILFVASDYQGKMSLMSDVYLYTIAEGNTRKLTQATHAISYAYRLEENAVVFLGSDLKTYGLNENPCFFKINLSTLAVEAFSPHFNHSIGNTVGTDCRFGNRRQFKVLDHVLYFITTEFENAYLNALSPTGDVHRLSEQPGSVDDFDVTNENIVVSAMRGNALNELYQIDAHGNEKILTKFNAWVLETYPIATPIPLSTKGLTEEEVFGWVLKPRGYVSDKKYPAILNIHGGPKTVYGTIYHHEMQAWANAGYFVFFCNPRGSDGRGNAFADIRGLYGTIDYDDIMAFTDLVLNTYPSIDSKELFVTGGSYGGYMTNWIVGHTHRFKAAAAQRSISNWTTEYGVTDIGYFFVKDQIGETPMSNYEKLWQHSPLKYADQIKTPLLLIHSDQDYRCWVPEAMQLFTALKDLGVETRLCLFKGENHELNRSGKPKNRIKRLEEITGWFENHRSKGD